MNDNQWRLLIGYATDSIEEDIRSAQTMPSMGWSAGHLAGSLFRAREELDMKRAVKHPHYRRMRGF